MPGRRRVGTADPLGAIGCTDAVAIASGGSSVVYRARQEAFDRLVAVKVLALPVIDERARRRFQRELAMAGRLTGHPNVVTVFASGFLPDGRGYVQMEYCPGGSLADRLTAGGVLAVQDVVGVGVKICGVLELAAREGIVHRDVKPANILVTRFGEPALSDFGVAVLASEGTATSQALTPAHASPEVLESRPAGPAADQWSLASTLHTLLAGRPPFAVRDGEGMLAGMLRVLSDPVPAIPRSDLPAALQAVLERAMAKAPDDRWPSAGDFGRSLQSVERQAGWPVTPMPVEEVAEARPEPGRAGNAGRLAPPPAGETTMPGPRHRVRAEVRAEPPLADTPPLPDPSPPPDPPARPGRPEERTHRWSRRPAPPRPDAPAAAGARSAWARWRWVVLAIAGGLVVLGVVIGLVTSIGSPSPRVTPRTPRLQAPSPALAGALAPRQVEVVNEQPTRVTIQWVDPSHGLYPFVVRVSTGVVQTAVSHTEAIVTGLDPTRGYCFVVGAVYGIGGQVANAPPVCVRGGTM